MQRDLQRKYSIYENVNLKLKVSNLKLNFMI